MTEHALRACRILIVEDEYLLAADLAAGLEEMHAIVVGPAGTIEDAFDLLGSEPALDGAILDVNLQGEMTFGLADWLAARDIPFVFATGYDPSVIPERFAQVARCEKPININMVARTIDRAIRAVPSK